MKKSAILLFLLTAICFKGMAYPKTIPAPGDVIPDDMPTLEALINLHKTMASAEENAMKKVAASKVEQDGVTNQTNKFYQVRDAINSKLDVAYQWITLAGSLSTLTISTANLVKEYGNYTSFFTKNVKKKPQIAFHYAECSYMVYKKVVLVEKSMATLAASNFNIFKATMKERMQLIWDLQTEIDELRNIIDSSYNWAQCVVWGGFHYDFIWEILNSQVMDEIAQDVINKWNSDHESRNFI